MALQVQLSCICLKGVRRRPSFLVWLDRSRERDGCCFSKINCGSQISSVLPILFLILFFFFFHLAIYSKLLRPCTCTPALPADRPCALLPWRLPSPPVALLAYRLACVAGSCSWQQTWSVMRTLGHPRNLWLLILVRNIVPTWSLMTPIRMFHCFFQVEMRYARIHPICTCIQEKFSMGHGYAYAYKLITIWKFSRRKTFIMWSSIDPRYAVTMGHMHMYTWWS